MLKLDRIRVCYGDFPAVSSVSLEVRQGEVAALLGTNGSGKSTLLKAMAGLMPPASGKMIFQGEDVTGLPAEKLIQRGLCLVPAGGRCFPRLSVQDNLIVGSYPRAARRFVRDSLDMVYALFPALAEKKKEPAGTLSGGQRQMVAIGRALMSRPRCILFDEISLGLSPMAVSDVYACLDRLHREQGLTMLIVEQDADRVLSRADRCHVMTHGSLILSGPAAEMSRDTLRQAYFGANSEEAWLCS